MHHWGGDFKYFGDVSRAADEIGAYCRRYGRINVMQTKEKYGTARVYCSFGMRDLHTLFWPGYSYIQYPKWLPKRLHKRWYVFVTFPFFTPVQYVVVKWQVVVYRRAYKLVLAKYPHIRDEILDCPDWSEHLSGL